MESNVVWTGKGICAAKKTCYWTNSAIYACIWPTIKTNLRRWRTFDSLPELSCLLIVSSIESGSLHGRGTEGLGGLYTTKIPQCDGDLAGEVFSQLRFPLNIQFFALNRSENLYGRQPIPGMSEDTADADFIVSPLPSHPQNFRQNCTIGNANKSYTKINEITLVAACTRPANDHVNSGITRFVVYGFGTGKIGAGCRESEFGTAGTVRGRIN